ncbi:methyltransferase type 12 [Fusarium mexicanum]|uniref:Methyltransferase type 12 n=1 Tax=Fusarium mexicanum TaxID=751941 RepID=A0A8H5IZL2_9HYPO|nr:methyltransferase type 12 [Fusarium mexicanum]
MLNNQQQSAVDQKANFTGLYNHKYCRCSNDSINYLIGGRPLPQSWTCAAHTHQVLADRVFFASRERPPKPMVLGLDRTVHAVRYALGAGLIDAGWVEDLEVKDSSPDLRNDALQDIKQPLGRYTVIRTSSYIEIATDLRDQGHVTERLPGVVLRQRRLASAQEQSDAVAHVAARGLNPTGLEEMGFVCADVFIS